MTCLLTILSEILNGSEVKLIIYSFLLPQLRVLELDKTSHSMVKKNKDFW